MSRWQPPGPFYEDKVDSPLQAPRNVKYKPKIMEGPELLRPNAKYG